jgi:MgtC family
MIALSTVQFGLRLLLAIGMGAIVGLERQWRQRMAGTRTAALVAAGAPFQWKTVPQGAATSVWAGVVAVADEVGGRYCENCHVGNIVPDDVAISVISEGVRGYALDPANADALWHKSEQLVGESF